MDQKELEAKARELYNACPSVKPSWDSLGPSCKEVWMEYVEKGIVPEDYLSKRG